MIRNLLLLAVGAFALTLAPVFAEDKKEEPKAKTLEGSLVCTKCELKETKACGNCLIVKDAKDEKKTVKYYLTDKGSKEDYHGDICQAPKDAKVTGIVTEKDKKFTVTEAKVEFKK